MGRITDAASTGPAGWGNLNPAQMGDVAIDDYVPGVAGRRVDQAMMQQLFDMRNMGYTWEDIGGFVPEVNNLLDNPADGRRPLASRHAPAALANETFLDRPAPPAGRADGCRDRVAPVSADG